MLCVFPAVGSEWGRTCRSSSAPTGTRSTSSPKAAPPSAWSAFWSLCCPRQSAPWRPLAGWGLAASPPPHWNRSSASPGEPAPQPISRPACPGTWRSLRAKAQQLPLMDEPRNCTFQNAYILFQQTQHPFRITFKTCFLSLFFTLIRLFGSHFVFTHYLEKTHLTFAAFLFFQNITSRKGCWWKLTPPPPCRAVTHTGRRGPDLTWPCVSGTFYRRAFSNKPAFFSPLERFHLIRTWFFGLVCATKKPGFKTHPWLMKVCSDWFL